VLHLALTGNVASGKSSVARLFADWGATLIDADAIVRDLQRPRTPIFDRIVARFGPEIVAADGELDRARLRALVLADAGARRDLEAIVHPAVAAERERLIDEARRRGDAIIVSDIPLLFEVMDPEAFDAVVLVDAPEAIRRERLLRDRGISSEEADGLFRAQHPAADKRARSDFIIDNDSSRMELRDRAWRVWRQLRSRARANA
jgi:dephospho-CoA kinase